MSDVAIMRVVTFQIGIEQVQSDVSNLGLPYLDLDLASIQVYRRICRRTIGKFCRGDGHIFKM